MKMLLLILFIPFMLVHGQEDTENNNQDNSLFTIIIAIIASVIGSFVGGTVLGYIISNRIEQNKAKKELETIHILIKSDFSMMHRILETKKEILEKYKKEFSKDDNLANTIKNELDSITPDNLELKEYGKFTEGTKVIIIFVYWDLLENSDSLLKLQPDEIKTVKTAHDIMVKHEALLTKSWNYMINTLPENVRKHDTQESKLKQVKFTTSSHIELGLKSIKSVEEMLDNVNTIDWMDFESEVTVPKIEERYQQLRKDAEKTRKEIN